MLRITQKYALLSGVVFGMYHYGLVGNCQASALINQSGSIDWLCLPRPDSAPVFAKILDPAGGHFSIECPAPSVGSQRYLANTNILITRIRLENGDEFHITDFFPRFYEGGKIYKPLGLFRIVEPIRGNPAIKVCCNPVQGWEKKAVAPLAEKNSLRFLLRTGDLFLTASNPETLRSGVVTLDKPLYFALTYHFEVGEPLETLVPRLLSETTQYWRTWVQHCSIPSLYQKETIRSALTLKLHCYEDTGAILAALTTSLPEENGLNRNWDYRYCWLRDAYFVLSAFYFLGHFEEMESFLKFLLAIAYRHEHSHERLRPVYSLDQTLPIPETEHSHWEGFGKSAPVRSGNQAAEHIQNDVYGEMILTLAPIFLDERFLHLRTREYEKLISNLVRSCVSSVAQPDAGLWEIRNGWREHSFSNLMCWAGIERALRIRESGFLSDLDLNLAVEVSRAEKALFAAAKDGSLRNGPADPSYDAALLQLPVLRFPDAELCINTVEAISSELSLMNQKENRSFLYRYLRNDDFGTPKSSFLVCSFWRVQALARLGKLDLAKRSMMEAMTAANTLGLFSEHFLPEQQAQWGNFPQAYSHVGQINAAFAISPAWDQIL